MASSVVYNALIRRRIKPHLYEAEERERVRIRCPSGKKKDTEGKVLIAKGAAPVRNERWQSAGVVVDLRRASAAGILLALQNDDNSEMVSHVSLSCTGALPDTRGTPLATSAQARMGQLAHCRGTSYFHRSCSKQSRWQAGTSRGPQGTTTTESRCLRKKNTDRQICIAICFID